MTIEVLKTDGTSSGRSVTLPDELFSIEPNDHALYMAVKYYMANQRQGTHKSKEKSEVSGSTRKLHRQKGTGGSRKGSIKNPLFRGGGRIFGPKPRDYSFRLNKKVRDLAYRSALTYKAKDQAVAVVEDFTLEQHKTRPYYAILTNLGVAGSRSILVVDQPDTHLLRASRNIEGHQVVRASQLNTYQILNCRKLLFTETALRQLAQRSASNSQPS
ncbi:MAG: 50S ribosomal protein L4 [Chitinophagales bacterium]|nr:50S ribosomal protein L4 [Chitinophagales bacterium]MDW8394290.1 50S ribosomal protein L4 [Chitinophagales bacterium]